MYDANGVLVGVNYSNSGDAPANGPSKKTFITNAYGQILLSRETDHNSPTQEGHQILANGDLLMRYSTATGGFGSVMKREQRDAFWKAYDKDSSQSPLTGAGEIAPGEGAGSGGTVEAFDGDTLASIAQRVYGSADDWYRLADANNMEFGQVLKAGQVLLAPAAATASTTKLSFNNGKLIGSTAPNLPPPKADKSCIGVVLMFVAVIITFIVAPYLVGVLGTFWGTVAAAAVSNLATQGVAVAAGAQEGINWGSVAMSAVSAGITQGVGLLDTGSALVDGAIANAATQGVALALDLQEDFNWASVAGAAVSTQVSQSMTPKSVSLGSTTSQQQFNQGFASGGLSGLAGSLTTALLTPGKMNYAEIAGSALSGALSGGLWAERNYENALQGLDPYGRPFADAFGNALGNSIADGMRSAGTTDTFQQGVARRKAALPDWLSQRSSDEGSSSDIPVIESVLQTNSAEDFREADLKLPTGTRFFVQPDRLVLSPAGEDTEVNEAVAIEKLRDAEMDRIVRQAHAEQPLSYDPAIGGYRGPDGVLQIEINGVRAKTLAPPSAGLSFGRGLDTKYEAGTLEMFSELGNVWRGDDAGIDKLAKSWEWFTYQHPEEMNYGNKPTSAPNLRAAALDNMLSNPFAAMVGGFMSWRGASSEDIYYATKATNEGSSALGALGGFGGQRTVNLPAIRPVESGANVGLKGDLARRAGIPKHIELSKPDNVWGLDGQQLLTHYRMRGYDGVMEPPKSGTSGRAQVFVLEGHPEIKKVQSHPGGGIHEGPYYKFTMNNRTEVKVIDPQTYRPLEIGKKTTFYNQSGQRIEYRNGGWVVVK